MEPHSNLILNSMSLNQLDLSSDLFPKTCLKTKKQCFSVSQFSLFRPVINKKVNKENEGENELEKKSYDSQNQFGKRRWENCQFTSYSKANYDIEPFELIIKKTKLIGKNPLVYNRNLLSFDVTPKRDNKPKHLKSFDELIRRSKEKSSMKVQPTRKHKESKKIIKAVFNHEREKVLFKVENKIGPNIFELKSQTREEILKEDPLLLVYFYEKYLWFSKTKGFDSKTLKPLDASF